MADQEVRPLQDALGRAFSPAGLTAWLCLVVMFAGTRALLVQMYANVTSPTFLWLNVAVSIGPMVLIALAIFFLARALLSEASGYGRPMYLSFLGLVVLWNLVVGIVSFMGTFAVFASDPSPFVMTYGSPLVGTLGAIAVFPLVVRTFATAAGIAEPRLGSVWAFAFGDGRRAYLWYAAITLATNILGPFAFANVFAAGQGNELLGNLVQSAISGTGQLLRFMLAVGVVWVMASGWRREAEVFA